MVRSKLYFTVHGIETPDVSGADLEPEMWISRHLFESLIEHISPVVELTFDDGFASCWDIAFPILQARGLTAKFFITVGKLGSPGFLTREQVRELHKSGMTIGTHGMHHRPWRNLGSQHLKEEVYQAKECIESILEEPVTEAACPFGAYDRRSLNALFRSGIRKVYTSDRALPRLNDTLIPRYTIKKSDTENYIGEVVKGLHDVSPLGRTKMLLKRYR